LSDRLSARRESDAYGQPAVVLARPFHAYFGDSAGEFGAAFKGFLERTVAAAPVAESVVASRLRAHLGTDPAALPIVAEQFEPSEHPNLQAALDAWFQPSERSFAAIGVTSACKRFSGLGLADILTWAGPAWSAGPGQRSARSGTATSPSTATG
jgi:hypothetical protein